jgi:Flp pilus assembly protein TadD
MGDNHGAEKTLREALRAEPRNPRTLNNLGVVAAALGRKEDAAAAYRESMKADPRYAQAVGNLASLLAEEGKLTEAMEELRRLLALEPGNTEARLHLAGILRLLENYPEAMENYAAVLSADPSNVDALKGLAIAYGRTGERDKAFACYAKLEGLGGEDQDFRLDRAFLLKDTDQVQKAQEEVLRYLSAKPEDQKARVLLADIHAKQGHARQAAQILTEVLEASPEDAEASFRLAKLQRELGEPQRAIETMEGLINTLEQSSDPRDMDALSHAMEEYEKAIAEHEKDFRDEREKTIRKLRELAVDTAPPQKEKTDDDTLMLEDAEPLQEDAVPIINVGGLEPVFAVSEVDEELQLEEVDESIQEDAVSIEDERPPNLVNLLKGQELYEKNPALEMFEPQPQLPSQQPRGAQQQQGGPQGPPVVPAPAQPAQLTLSPQGESVLAQSLKESVAAQSRVVDKLFDEMRDLSRKIDERRPQQPMPPIVLTMPQGGAPSPRPFMMDLPSAGPQAEGFPRYATAGTAGEEGEQEEAEEGPPGGAPAPAPPPNGWPSLGPVTDTEPEPELEPRPVEEPEAELEPVNEAGEPEEGIARAPGAPGGAARPGTEKGAAAPGAIDDAESEPARSSNDVRKELRDYLNGVRDRLGKEPAKPSNPRDLLDYLGKLSDYLPEREKKQFKGSKERLAMEALKAQLAGKKGLRQKVAESFHPAESRRKEPMTRSLVVDTFSYLRDLASWHPDKAVGAAMRDRIESIVARMGRSG